MFSTYLAARLADAPKHPRDSSPDPREKSEPWRDLGGCQTLSAAQHSLIKVLSKGVTHRHEVLNLAADLQAVVHVGGLLEAPAPHKAGLPVRRPRHIANVVSTVELYALLPAPAIILSKHTSENEFRLCICQEWNISDANARALYGDCCAACFPEKYARSTSVLLFLSMYILSPSQRQDSKMFS